MNIVKLHQLIDQWAAEERADEGDKSDSLTESMLAKETPKKVLPEGKRVVRTKSSGDRVYFLDDVKKTRQWVTNPDVLKSLGFDLNDVVEVEDSELLKYQMAAALYRVENAA